ncbi:MAG: hypothetical protein KBF21_15935 [Thermoanaerobaculia bacterium]|nr:hypothetical protein [Thermoanaerobaculia bacterium]MBP9825717.1 hypothetical protein [Thermoanaerobaculia bacterium]
MRVYSVNYDLNRPGQNYAGLISELENSPNWWHFLKSSWLIATFETPEQLWDRISPHIDKSDTVLIIEVVNRSAGWMSQEAWDWINVNVRRAA